MVCGGIMAKRKVVCKTMKKILSLVIAAMLLVSCLAGCGKEDKGSVDTSSIPVSQGESTSSAASEEASSDESTSDKTSSEGAASDKTSSLVNSMPATSSKDEAPVCKHTKTKAVSVSTGKHVIDSSKLDALVHNVVCESCNKVLKTENHSVKDGKCTLCAQSNLATKAVGFIDAGPALSGEAQINDDGSVDPDVMLGASWYSATKSEYAIDEWNYKIPEAAMLEAIKTKFEINDAQFEALKAQGSYNFFLGDHTYKDGFFNISWPAAGGPGSYTHTLVGYKDNGAGSLTLYVDYQNGGPEDDKIEHAYYYAVEYKYSGYSNLTIITGEYNSKQIQGFSPVVDSLRVTAIKKLSTLPTDMIKVK